CDALEKTLSQMATRRNCDSDSSVRRWCRVVWNDYLASPVQPRIQREDARTDEDHCKSGDSTKESRERIQRKRIVTLKSSQTRSRVCQAERRTRHRREESNDEYRPACDDRRAGQPRQEWRAGRRHQEMCRLTCCRHPHRSPQQQEASTLPAIWKRRKQPLQSITP